MNKVNPTTRRRFLQTATAISLATPAATGTVLAAADIAKANPADQIADLISQLKQVIADNYPNVRMGFAKIEIDNLSAPLPIMITAHWVTGSYAGDGIYSGSSDWNKSARYAVKLLDSKIEGERGFSVIRVGETRRDKWMRLSESQFETFIGAKVGELA